MQVLSFPCPLANVEPEPLEASLQCLALPASPAGCGVLGRKFFQVLANQARQGGIPLDRNLPHLLDEFIVQRECQVHIPIIRETLNPWKSCDPPYSADATGKH